MKTDKLPIDPHTLFMKRRDLIDEALKQGVREAAIRHKQAGLPMVIYRDGKCVWLSADEMLAEIDA
jgi:hypothetical protein